MSKKEPFLGSTILEVQIGQIEFSYIYPSTLRTREVFKLTKEQKRCLEKIRGVWLSSIVLDIPATEEAIDEAIKCLGAFKVKRYGLR